jgi:hypothetical protein
MSTATQHLPVILLLGKKNKSQDDVDKWLAESPYLAHEASNVFQALEQISDFTVRDTPDVVFLHVDRLQDELAMLETMLETTGNPCASVLAFSDQARNNLFDSGLPGLEQQLDRLIQGISSPC